jgi:predicted transcriptional regulator of viral defense system
MKKPKKTQQKTAVAILERLGLARPIDLERYGITRTTLARMVLAGTVERVDRGLYRLVDNAAVGDETLAKAAKLVSSGVICLTSALAFHELTDVVPSRVWIAVQSNSRQPSERKIPLQVVRFRGEHFTSGIEKHVIGGVTVRIYNPSKTIVDLFRYRKNSGTRYKSSPGLNIAIAGMREALKQRKATPANIAKYAIQGGVWKIVEPYLTAMTADA